MKSVKVFSALLAIKLVLLFSSCHQEGANLQKLTWLPDDNFNFIVANDLGRNGYYDQKLIAEQMGSMAEDIDIEFVAAAGDVHHFEGVASVNDPLWITNYEHIYSHPELMLDWYPIMGNHEYRGNTQAVLDYSGISRRWCMPGRYYAKSFEVGDSSSLKVVFIDTTPLIDKYHKESEESYRDVAAQDMEAQLHWIDSVLNASDETWKIVIGHHPVYAQTPKDEEEREDLQERLDPLLKKYGVDMYIAGHIHNFQHIRKPDSHVDYVVNSSASLSREVSEIDGTQFCSSEPGYSVVSVSDKDLSLYMIDKNGRVLYTVTRVK